MKEAGVLGESFTVAEAALKKKKMNREIVKLEPGN